MGVLDNLGYIKQAAAYPCGNVDISLTLQAAANAGAITLWQAATFGCNDIVKMRAGLSPWHSRGLKALVDGILKPEEKNLVSKWYKFIIPLEKALFFWFVVDLTTGFIANWQSQMFKLGACETSADYGYGSGSAPEWICPAPGVYANVAYTNFTHSGPRAALVDHHGFIVPAGYYYSCFFSLKPKPFVTGESISYVDQTLREILDRVFILHAERSEPPWLFNEFKATAGYHGHNKHTHAQEYFYVATCDKAAFADGGSLDVQVSSVPLMNTGLVPVNCFGAPAADTFNPV